MAARTSSAVDPPKPKSMQPTPNSRSALMSAASCAGEPANSWMLAVTGLGRRGLAEHRDAQGQAHRLRIAACLGDHLAQARHLGLEPRQAVERILLVGADRIPSIAEAGRSPQRRAALAADPDRRVRLLDRLRIETDIGASAHKRQLAREQAVLFRRTGANVKEAWRSNSAWLSHATVAWVIISPTL